jgi:2-(1,2-epoxy-1,2-dihydrophenyl)acetyl-CoA isomerase
MSSVLLHIEKGIGVITLNRPEKLNAFNQEMALNLQSKLDECATEPEVRCLYITGEGKGFSAGQDLTEVTGPEAMSMEQILSEHYNPIVTRIRNIPKPVVAAVNGVAAGAGANIALCCDIVLASQSASFIQAFSKIGLIPDSGGTYFLPRLIGWQRASALMMLGERLGAPEALVMGMIYKVFPDAEFKSESLRIAGILAAMPTKALGLTKHALNYSFSNSLEGQLLTEDELQQKAVQTDDYREGLDAFLKKREPKFKGQ